ncbi:DUF5667 domain-containing protein [Blastococcus xanthinilyticus]|uniref:DUF5667 domain-containing protein n=1 Tax=Blastococcus xanthinilyticus TaxID=1564164 RepID=A0A5S5D0Q7_9ACTN|nr:DUF5667 domain-containing protein [Blastococcus xanthinilyticus]TYP89623.1 hypothetical protein BD833_10296 [Blastococcus xanthinilyticus]
MTGHGDASPSGPLAVRDREDSVVTRLQLLGDQLDGAPDPAYHARARARLVAMAAVRTPGPARAPLRERLLAVRAVDRAPSRWRGRLTAALAGAAVGVTGLAALVAVAAGAQPGDPLYDLKRGTEQTQLALAGDSRGRTLLELASTRLDELEELAADGPVALVAQTLRTMDEHTAEGAALLTGLAVRTGDAMVLDALARWTGGQSAQLDALGPGVPVDAAAAYADSTGLLRALTVRASGLRIALQCSSGPATVGDDDLGPVPGLCLADLPPAAPSPAPAPAPAPAPVAPEVTPAPDPATPPSAGPGTPAPPVAVPDGPADPGQGAAPTEAATPPSVVPPAPDGRLVPTLPPVPQPGGPGASTGTPPRPPVITVPLPGPVRICLPPLAIGRC